MIRKTLMGAGALAAVLLAVAPATAQAPSAQMATGWPAPGTPAKAMADLPNPPAIAESWNGIWNGIGGLVFDKDHAVLPPDPANGAGFEYGPRPGAYMTNIPYKPEYQKEYEETVKKAIKGIVFDPMGSCISPHGMPRIAGQGGPGPMELVVRKNQVWMMFDYMNETRRIYTDGRGHHKPEEAFGVNMAHSIGRWEGDVLVVDSTEMMKGIFDRTGAPHSSQVHVTERIRLVDPNTLQDDLVIEDPVVLTRPWVVSRQLRRSGAGAEVTGSYCQHNRNDLVGVDGSQTAILATDTVRGQAVKKPAAKKAPAKAAAKK